MRSATVYRRWRVFGLALAFLALSSCGGSGGSSSPPPPPLPPSKLFVTDGGSHALASSVNAAPTVGSNFTIDRVVQGSNTGMGLPGGTPSVSSIPSIALDAAADRMFVATQASVVSLDNVSTATGNIPSSRQFSATVMTDGVTSRSVNFLGLSLNPTSNVLYTVDSQAEVHVFNNANARNGTTTPDRTITPDLGTISVVTTFGVAIDKVKDMLYVGVAPNAATPFIIVFNNASTLNTNTAPNNKQAPDRTITLAGAGAFHLDDAGDRLYVATSGGQAQVFDTASGLSDLNGPITASRTFALFGGVQNFIFVDTSRNKLYAVSNSPFPPFNQSALDIIDNASTANGTPTGVSVVITATDIRLSAVAVKP
jgi:hypothetical protein